MGYENRLPPEGINVGKSNPLLEVFLTLAGVALAIILLVVMLYFMGSAFASYIPFSWEERLTRQYDGYNAPAFSDPRSKALQQLANRLAASTEVPAGISFHVQFVDDKEVNAYATLGGIIRLHRGLLEQLHSENAVAMVLAHEMAHVIHRDPAEATGGRLLVSVTMGLIASVAGIDALRSLADMTSSLTLLSFSREAEHQADMTGLHLVAHLYGHMGGVGEVFERLAAYEAKVGVSAPELLSSHPETAGRNQTLRQEAEKLQIPLQGALTNLPASLRSGRE